MNSIHGRSASFASLKAALAVGASGLALGLAAGALAQPVDTIPEDSSVEETSDRLVVTGSRIRRQLDETIAVTDIDAAQVDLRGFVNTIEGLEQLPFVAVGVNNEGNPTQFGDNNAFTNLLNFGSNRTVTLIDGRRFVSSNQGTVFVPGNVSGAQVDLSIINPALISRTEIQTVGSGPIYGADAVAGVVNVILDREFEGLEFTAQGGLTDEGDGAQYRFAGAWGTEIFGGRGNFIVGVEYSHLDQIVADENRPFTGNIELINNPLSFTSTDQIPNTVFQANQLNPRLQLGGRLDTRQTDAGSIASFFFPNGLGPTPGTCTGTTGAQAAFCAANGNLTPYQFAVANPDLNGINPLAFVGTFGLTSGMPTIPVTPGSPEALAGLTRIAVPLTFDASGNPVPFAFGPGLIPPNIADQDDVIGVESYDPRFTNSLRAGQDRYTFNSFFSYDFSDNLKYRGDVLFSQIDNFQNSDNFQTNVPNGASTSGNANIPIYYNQNPFVTPATLAQVNAIIAANTTNPFTTIGGEPVFYLSRALADISGSLEGDFTNFEGNRSRTYGTSHSLTNDFNMFGNDFYWDVTFAYSLNTSENDGATDILDIEFALATDVVDGPNGPVCRQQTLGAPEPVNVRNPFLTNINIATGITPTQAQIDACVPLNLFGAGNASQAAIDYVTAESDSSNKASQFFGSAQLGGDLIQLPAGPLSFNSEFQWRRETLTFTPGPVFNLGLARATIGQPSDGFARFFEGGTEFNVPIFGNGFQPFFFNLLELQGAVRVVNRAGEGTPNGISNPRVETRTGTAVTFTAGGRFSPFEGITFRGNRTRAVRSPSIVESLGAPQTGFSALAGLFPCNGNNRNNGPSSGIRITNCNAFEASLGLPAGTFAGLFPPGGTVPAGVGGNPNLQNEIANNWTVGVVLQPSFIPGLTIQSDWIDLQLDRQIALTFLGLNCFDQEDFPVSIVGGVPTCETITLGTGTGPLGLDPPFTIPATNIITGSPVAPPAIPGLLTVVQAPFTIGVGQFSNANSGSIRLSALNSRIRYNFDMLDVTDGLGLGLPDLGSVQIDGYVYYIDKFQTSASGTFGGDTANNAGEPGNEKFQTRLDLTHNLGAFTHQIQWFRNHKSVVNVDSTAPLDQSPDFFRPQFNTFNYNVAYDINDNFTARLIVNNLTDATLLPEFGLAGDVVGRTFIARVDARF